MMLGLCSASVGEEMETGDGTIAAMQSLAIWHISFALSDYVTAVIRQRSSSAKVELTLSLYLYPHKGNELLDTAGWSDSAQGSYQNC